MFHYSFKDPSEEGSTGIECQDGDVKLNKDGTPLIFWDNLWSPLCGHYFWDNQYGAEKCCQKLGYPSGMHFGKPIQKTYPVDSFSVGTCLSEDKWPCCTGGENYFSAGRPALNGTCDKSNDQAIVIKCIGGPKSANNPSCNGIKYTILSHYYNFQFIKRYHLYPQQFITITLL